MHKEHQGPAHTWIVMLSEGVGRAGTVRLLRRVFPAAENLQHPSGKLAVRCRAPCCRANRAALHGHERPGGCGGSSGPLLSRTRAHVLITTALLPESRLL